MLANAHSGPAELADIGRLDDALDLLAEEPYDVVLLDLKLPDARGVEGVDRLRQLVPDVPVVVLSEPGDEALTMQAVDHGAQEFVVRGANAGDQLLSVIRQAIARKQSETRLSKLALNDGLTGLANRTLLHERLERASLRADRERQAFALLFVDLDGFKHVNDMLGHEFGDHLLQGVARRLESIIRRVDTVARFGGDEFVLILEGLKRRHDAAVVAQKALQAVHTPLEIAGHQLHVGASIGISVYPDDATDLEELLRLADLAMYEAKQTGRNRFVFHGQSDLTEDGLEPLSSQRNEATAPASA